VAPRNRLVCNAHVSDSLAARLATIVGTGNVFADADRRATYETDWTRRFSGPARLVARPGSTAEVAAVLGACADAGAAVVPQGGNTGLVGGSVPRGGEVVLSTLRLTSIESLDAAAGEVTVGAGLTVAALNEAAAAHGLRFGVDLASRDSATLGGMAATNAGGINVVRYGMMRAQVLGMEAALPDGGIVSRLFGVGRDNTGYDLPNLFVGSEGTLAVVSKLRLRLVPMLPQRAVVLLAFDTLGAAIETALRARREVEALTAAECFFAEGLDLVCRHAGIPAPFTGRWPYYILLEAAARTDQSMALAGAVADAPGVRDSALATDARDRTRLWAYRDRHTEAINAEGVPHKLDVAIPLARLDEFAKEVRAVVLDLSPAAQVVLFGHIAEGNLHVNILGFAPDDERPDEAVLRLVASMGGSISAEHGIGVAKARWLELTRPPADIAAMRAVKAALDPRGIMNPGVLFPRPESQVPRRE
jgi:FAD/FMN-containing dehydrogenase